MSCCQARFHEGVNNPYPQTCGQGRGQAKSPLVVAKEIDAQGLKPIDQYRFVEAWRAVNKCGDVIAVGEHLCGRAAECPFVYVKQWPAAEVHKERPYHQQWQPTGKWRVQGY